SMSTAGLPLAKRAVAPMDVAAKYAHRYTATAIRMALPRNSTDASDAGIAASTSTRSSVAGERRAIVAWVLARVLTLRARAVPRRKTMGRRTLELLLDCPAPRDRDSSVASIDSSELAA